MKQYPAYESPHNSPANQYEYEPEYDLDAARERNAHAEKVSPKFKAMMDRLRQQKGTA